MRTANESNTPIRFQIILADLIIEIRCQYDRIYHLCEKYVINCCEVTRKPDIIVSALQSDIKKESIKARKEQEKDGHNSFQIIFNDELEELNVYRKICEQMPLFNAFLLHGSAIGSEGNGYILTAPSGTGKTTRTMRWLEEIPRSVVINGDKPLIKLSNGTFFVYGTPWSGKEHLNTNTRTPLRAILLIERADADGEVQMTRLASSEAYLELLSMIYRPEDEHALSATLFLLKMLVEQVTVFRFHGTPTRESVRKAWETVKP